MTVTDTTPIPSYPLQWPLGVPRTAHGRWVRNPFKTNYHRAVENVVNSLRGFHRDAGNIKIEHPVISSNIDLMGRLLNNDPGAAVWFLMDGSWVAFGVDRFPDAAANVQAIHHIIEARRTELRYGGLQIVRQTFKSFAALPAPPGSHWSDVFGISRTATPAEIETAYRMKAVSAHPDKGGSNAAMSALNVARQAAIAERPA